MDERKTILQRMDDMVAWTGVPAMSQGKIRRRPFRWLSALALAGGLGGFVAGIAAGFVGRAFVIGYMVMIASFLLGMIVQVFGPLKPFNSFTERADEFDRALRTRAYMFAFPAFALATLLALVLLMWMILMDWPRGALMSCLSELMFMLVTLGFTLPTAYASWAVQWDKSED